LAPRRTIAREIEIEGVGLHEGRPTRLTLRPAESGGVRFIRTDLQGSAPIPALASAREERPRRTAIVAGLAEVHTVEHLLAAVAGLGITDLEVRIDQIEVPGLDGSSLPFFRAIEAAGTRDLPGEAPVLVLDRVVALEEKGARIVAMPCPGRLVLEYVLDYAAVLPRMRFVTEVTPRSFACDLAPARTFCLEQEARALQAAGLGKGASAENTLVVGADGLPIGNVLRFPDEYARHKALDLVGDLALLGARLEARVLAWKAGHALNAALARKLAEILAEERADRPGGGAESERDPPLVSPGGGALVPPAVAFEGHFPRFPVLPGVVSIAAMADAAEARIAAIDNARFRRMARPGEPLEVALERRAGGRARGALRAAAGGGALVAEATLALRPCGRATAPISGTREEAR
jgi:UDP-3-O-[3-hydroxymyristoyl] N-acetylglucosamine deacetylase/3-hydroxyacyl-[acyl-carrier-protein] dehydratase